MKKQTRLLLLAALLCTALSVPAQEQTISLSFEDAPIEQAVELYREWTGRTILKQADLSARITLKGRDLTKEEAKQAIETVLAMNGVALVPMGDKFLKVVPITSARQEGMEIKSFDPEEKYTEADSLMTQVIPLRFVLFTDVQAIIQHLIHAYGSMQYLERINSVLVTDTSANIARIVEVINMVDQPVEKIEPRIYQLKYAESTSVASKLKELVEAAKTKKSEQNLVAGGARSIPGVIRANPGTSSAGNPFATSAEEQTEMIVGEVKFVADERTNILIVFSKAANFDFFDSIIKVLDVPVDPAVVVEVVNLEYAEAKEIAGILNEFVGAAKETEKTKSPGETGEKAKDGSLTETVREIARTTGRTVSPEVQNAIGRLSEDTKILSDERTNSLLLMGRKSDVEAIKKVIKGLDVMLEQVLIETVVLSVGLGDKFTTGMQWVYDTAKGTETLNDQVVGQKVTKNTTYNGTGIPTNTVSTTEDVLGSITRVLPSQQLFGFNASGLATNMASGALSYYATFPSLNIKTILSAAKSDSDTRVLSTPVVLTTDNTEATITIAEERPVITSSINSSADNYSARATYEYKTIGIELTVTPHINPERFVLMEIKQSADDVGGNVSVDGNEVPVISKREISATVAVQDRSTIVLGGLVRKGNEDSTTKIPLLGDIPLLGWFFSTHNKDDSRSELVVLLTPYVLTNPEEASLETKRRLHSSDVKNTEWPRGWSQSELANDEPAEEQKAEQDSKQQKAKKDSD